MINVAIKSSELQRFIEEQVKSGQYPSADDVVAAGLALLRSDPDATLGSDELEELRRDVGIGIAQADRKQFSDFSAEDVIAEGRKKLNEQMGK
ncbi:MAG: ribbon-helix-helix domain-containing protein [Phycisphaerae bacterium]